MDDTRSYAPFGVAALILLVSFFAGDYALLARLTAIAVACAGVVWLDSRWGIVAASTLGLGSSAYLFSRKLDSTGVSLCEANAVQNCDLVNSSAASELFGIPISLLGSGFFLGLIAAAVLATDETQRTRLFRTTGLLAAVGCVFSAYLFIQILALETSCPFCYSIYMANGILLWAGLKGLGEVGGILFDDVAELPASSTFVTVAGTFVAVVLFGFGTYNNTDSSVAAPIDPTVDSDVERLRSMYAPPSGPV
ncbi:MAG: vitamin K epoxide reductase family protein, partial [Myxococcota bacterium]